MHIIVIKNTLCNENVIINFCLLSDIAPDKNCFQPKPADIFLISLQNHMLWNSLVVAQQGASNEYPKCMFLWRIKKKKNYVDTPSCLELCQWGASDEYPQIFSQRNRKKDIYLDIHFSTFCKTHV